MRWLDRYIIWQLLRVGLLTTLVLVTVIAFGAAIKPLASNDLLSISQTVKYIALAIVPMLQFALPFAAGFAGTLSMHRMATDNEILAAAVSGVSYRRILAPILSLGLAIMLVMILLTQWAIPLFWTLLERTVALDATRVFQASIERGEPFQFGDRQIWADRVIAEHNPEGTEADTRLILLHVAAAELNDAGRIDKEVTANSAVVDVYREPGVTFVKLAMSDTVAYDPAGGVLLWTEHSEFRPIILPGRLESSARDMTRGQLLALREDPDQYGLVIERKLNLADSLRDAELWRQLDRRLESDGVVELDDATRPERRFVVTAGAVEAGRFRGSGDTVEVTEYDGDAPLRRFLAAIARLDQSSSGLAAGGNVAFDVMLEDCEVTDLQGVGTVNHRRSVRLENLALAGFSVSDLANLSSDELIGRVEEYGLRESGRDGTVMPHVIALRATIDELYREITARLLARYALSATAVLLLVLGATLAMWLRRSLPLTIYLWAFLPSVVDLLLINTGEHMMRDDRMFAGAAIMWSGNMFLMGAIGWAYLKLARH